MLANNEIYLLVVSKKEMNEEKVIKNTFLTVKNHEKS